MLNIAVFLGELQLDSQSKTLRGITDAAVSDGNNVYVYALNLNLDRGFNAGEFFIAANENFEMYDGFIIYAESIYSEEIRLGLIDKIKKTGKPCASIDYSISGFINVSSNNERAMRELAHHMIHEHGVKVVNFIGGPDDSIDSVIRKRVLMDEMRDAGLTIDPRRFYVGDYYARSGRSAVEYFEKQGIIKADAYICANDQMALGAFYALSQRGLKVPDDTLMSGYDDIFQASNHYPRITSVKRYEEKIGESAYRGILNAINGEEYEKYIVVESNVIFAESCGCSVNHPLSHRDVIDEYVEKSLRETRYAEMVSDFSAIVTSVQSYEDIGGQLKKFIPLLGGDAYLASFYEEANCADKIKTSVFSVNGRFGIIDSIPRQDIVGLFGDEDGGNLYVINSIHFGDKCYGYSVIRNSSMPMQSEFYRIFAITMGSTIEHVNNYQAMQHMIKTLDEMWVFDPMTHVYNRAGFFKFADVMVNDARYAKEDMFLIFLDVDGLKKVNDVHGHEMGDRLICEMADVLRKSRDKEDLLMRYGGDEFVVLGRGYNIEKVEKYIDKIRKTMDEVNHSEGVPFKLDASIGYSRVAYDESRPLSALIELADQKMYEEKREKHKREGR